MTDLVERLRAWDKSVMFAEEAHEAADALESNQRDFQSWAEAGTRWSLKQSELEDTIAALRAQILADEEMINTLRAENESLSSDFHDMVDQRNVAQAEIARLRAALERIANCKDDVPHSPAAFINAIAEEGAKDEAIGYLSKEWNVRTYLQHVARAALNGEKE